MNNEKKESLKKVLITGIINVYEYEQIKREIFDNCSMSTKNVNDRMKWSNWINAKSIPQKKYREEINNILVKHQMEAIYD